MVVNFVLLEVIVVMVCVDCFFVIWIGGVWMGVVVFDLFCVGVGW